MKLASKSASFRFALVLCTVIGAAAPALAQNTCKLQPDECAVLERARRELVAKERAEAQKFLQEQRAYEAEKAARDQQRSAEIERIQQVRREDEARRLAEVSAREAERERAEAAAAAAAARTEAARKERCGVDYRSITIGMTVPRVLECVSGSFRMKGQSNTAQGVVTTYIAPGGYFHAIDGKVVQWGKF